MEDTFLDSAKCINCKEWFDCDRTIQILLCQECLRIEYLMEKYKERLEKLSKT